ncbi:MAG: nitrous oxide reductase family maturation protein NosD, partial [Promethearchaeota archaeon]
MMRMQVFRRRFVIAASLFLVLLVFPVFVNPTSVDGGVSPDCKNKGIYIKSNEDFRKYDFRGEGTEDEPFIIEGLQLEIRGFGIRIRGTTAHFIIRDSVFEGKSKGWGSTGIYLANVENGVIEDCAFSDVNRGFGIHKSENIVIQGNEISSVRIGIQIKHSSSILIMNNEITDSKWCALFLAFSFDCTVTYNTIANNDGIGVFLYDSGSCTLFGNYFESNMWVNARDAIGDHSATYSNLWDDDVSLGNDWDDYEGIGVYPISGDRGSVDRYPIGSDPDTVAPEWITAPIEQTIECGDTFKMVVEADDDSGISTYWIDDTDLFSIEFIDSSVDYKANITCNQPLAFGEYTVEVRAYDPFNNFCSATFTVTVQDT